MVLNIEQKASIVKQYAKNPKDTGSSRVQVALITSRINDLQLHFAANKKDNHSKRGLLKLVSRRRRLLDYIKRINIQEYRSLIQDLGIRR